MAIVVLVFLILLLAILILYMHLQEYWSMYLPVKKLDDLEITSTHNPNQHIKETTHIAQADGGIYFTKENTLMYMSEDGTDIKEVYTHSSYIEKIIVLDDEVFLVSLGRIYKYSKGEVKQIIDGVAFNNYFIQGREIFCLGFDNTIKKYDFNGKLISEAAAPFKSPPAYYDYVIGQNILYNEEEHLGVLVPHYYRFNKSIIRYTYNEVAPFGIYDISDEAKEKLSENIKASDMDIELDGYELDAVSIGKLRKYREYEDFLYVKGVPELTYIKDFDDTSNKEIYDEKINILGRINTKKIYEKLGDIVECDLFYLGEYGYYIEDFKINDGYIYILEQNNLDENESDTRREYKVSKLNIKSKEREVIYTGERYIDLEMKVEITDNYVFLCEYSLNRLLRIHKMDKTGGELSTVLDLGKEIKDVEVN